MDKVCCGCGKTINKGEDFAFKLCKTCYVSKKYRRYRIRQRKILREGDGA